MEIIVGKLQQMLKKLKPVAGESVRLECKEVKFRASVFNNDLARQEKKRLAIDSSHDLWMEVSADHACEEPIYGSCPIYVPYKDLVQLFAGADQSASVEFFSDGKIKYKDITYKLYSDVEFPVAEPHKRMIALNISGLRNVMSFVSGDEYMRQDVHGVNAKADGNLFFTGTDGRVLKKVDMGKTRSKFDVIIPYEASKLLCSASEVRFGRSKTKLSFEYDGTTIVTTYTTKPYPDVDSVFKAVKDETTITVNRAMLIEKVYDVSRVLTLKNRYPGVGVMFNAADTRSLELSAKYEHGIATTTIEADITGAGKVMFNPRMLYTILDSIDTDQVTFKLWNWDGKVSGPVPPVGIVGADNEQMAIMPVEFTEREG